jgi:general secretion pathway protein K
MNINTVAPELVMALADGIQPDAVERFIEVRGDEGFDSLNAALSHEAFAGKKIEDGLLAVSSQWFMVRVEMEIGRIYRRAQSKLLRVNNEPAVAVSRSYNLD